MLKYFLEIIAVSDILAARRKNTALKCEYVTILQIMYAEIVATLAYVSTLYTYIFE